MELVSVLQNSIDYMESHLLEKINYEDAAREVHISCYNFHRIFSLMAGMTANEYIRKRRLSLAGEELQATKNKIIDVAYKYGYESPESFAKAFSRFHGVSPKLAREKGTELVLFNPLVIKITLEGGRVMNYRIEEVKDMKFIAMVRAFDNESMNDKNDHSIPEFWKECHDKHLIDEIRNMRKSGKKDLYGLCTPTIKSQKTFDYGIGVLIDDNTNMKDEQGLLNNGYRIWNLKAGTYVVFKCYGDDESGIREIWTRYFNEFLPHSNYKESEETDFELYFEKGEEGLFCEVWIPVNKIK